MNATPAPVGQTAGGQDIYDGREIAAWRASLGITQEAVAAQLKVARPYVARLESERYGPLDAKNALRLIKAVETIVLWRDRIVVQGVAALEEIRAARKAVR